MRFRKTQNTISQMAVLSLNQARELMEAPKNKQAIQKALKHELRMRLHTEPIIDKGDYTEAHKEFLQWVYSMLPTEDKQARFAQLFTLPVCTNDLCDNIYLEFPRVLEAHNKYIKNTFTTEEAEIDFKRYCDDLGFFDFFKAEGMEAIKKHINSFIVVDLPVSQKVNGRPEPYFYMLHIDQVVDVVVKKDGLCDYIIFCQDVTFEDAQAEITKRIAVFDDNNLRVFIFKNNAWIVERDVVHGLGICPAFKFYPEYINKKNRLNSLSPITPSLGALDKLAMWITSKDYYKQYGTFPIYWGYKQDCTYKDAETGGVCDGNGQIIWDVYDDPVNRIGIPKTQFKPCPKCAAKKLFGPGTFIEVDPPRGDGDSDLREPVGYVGVDVDALQYISDDITAQEARILYNTTGNVSASAQAKQAINEIQVRSIYESRQNCLIEIKKNFEKAMYWSFYMLAKFRYGSQYVSTTVDLGNEFFLVTKEELNKQYSETKAAGRPNYELASKREFMYLTEYHNNPEELARLNILQNIEPYQDYSVGELKSLGIPQTDPDGFIIKVNFYSFVKRFERENLPIVIFGSDISFKSKVEIIYNTLKKYANEQLQQANRTNNPFTPTNNQKV